MVVIIVIISFIIVVAIIMAMAMAIEFLKLIVMAKFMLRFLEKVVVAMVKVVTIDMFARFRLMLCWSCFIIK